jgi:predicted nuclease of predicted toxin-antitoxin system
MNASQSSWRAKRRETDMRAHHVAHLGRASWKDWALRDYAIRYDFVLVTNNASDFRVLYAATDLHPGLVILVPNVVQERQVLLFREALNPYYSPGLRRKRTGGGAECATKRVADRGAAE